MLTLYNRQQKEKQFLLQAVVLTPSLVSSANIEIVTEYNLLQAGFVTTNQKRVQQGDGIPQ